MVTDYTLTFEEFQIHYDIAIGLLNDSLKEDYSVENTGILISKVKKLVRISEVLETDFETITLNKTLEIFRNAIYKNSEDRINLFSDIKGELDTLYDYIYEKISRSGQISEQFPNFISYNNSQIEEIVSLINMAIFNINSNQFISPKVKDCLINQLHQVIKDLLSKTKRKNISKIVGSLKEVIIAVSVIGAIISGAKDGVDLINVSSLNDSKEKMEEAGKLIENSFEPDYSKNIPKGIVIESIDNKPKNLQEKN